MNVWPMATIQIILRSKIHQFSIQHSAFSIPSVSSTNRNFSQNCALRMRVFHCFWRQKISLHKLKKLPKNGMFCNLSYPHCPQGYPQQKPQKPLPNHVWQGSSYKTLHSLTFFEKCRFGFHNTIQNCAFTEKIRVFLPASSVLVSAPST